MERKNIIFQFCVLSSAIDLVLEFEFKLAC